MIVDCSLISCYTDDLIELLMQKTCEKCQQLWEIDELDEKFYSEMKVPHPRLCPECRSQRRLAWRNERNLYIRKCDATGKQIFSVYSSDKPFPVYQNDYWYSDSWDAKTYGRDFDFNRPFFDQFEELMNSVPQLALSTVENQNCDYINQAGWCKDCYLIFEANYDEGCMYSNYIRYSRDTLDCLKVERCELCYECINCENCYSLKYSEDCNNSSDSWFLKACIGCQNCFGSVNLRNKQYYFFNEKLSKEEYEKKMASLDLSRSGLEKLKAEFRKHVLKYPHKSMHGVQNESCSGDYISNSKNCRDCFDLDGSQDCRYVVNSMNMKDVYDVTVFGAESGAAFCYDSHEVGESVRNILFSDQIWLGCSDIMYSKLCLSDNHHLFGCVGLRHSSYCIFNKQYTKEEYEILVPKIIDHMKKTGEWGEFFPGRLSPYGYNETLAQDFYPLTKEQALAQGFKWKEDEVRNYSAQKNPTPERIAETADSIVQEILACAECGKNYKVVARELNFYRKMNLPVPVKCHDCRHEARFRLRTPRKLWNRKCEQCKKAVQTTYAPDRPEKVYCEACYLQAVD